LIGLKTETIERKRNMAVEWKRNIFVSILILALGLPIIEPNVIPLEAAFQGE
jgi:hypothetical protein